MLRTKCILAEPHELDGLRVSIMSRHTLKDGKTPDTRIKPDMFDEHWVNFAAPLALIGAYSRDEIDWEEYEAGFKEYTSKSDIEAALKNLADICMSQNVTLMCIEATPEECHRRLVAERCLVLNPQIELCVK